MYGKRLIELSKAIGEMVKSIKLMGLDLDAHDRCIVERKLKLVPEGGWPGKNEGERKINEMKVLAEDEELTQMHLAKLEVEKKKLVLDADLGLFMEERRGIEFAVRDALATALGGYSDDETEKVLDVSAEKKAVDITKTTKIVVEGEDYVLKTGEQVVIPVLAEVAKETADGSFELPAIPEGTPVTKIVPTPVVEGGPVKFDPVAQEFVKDESFVPVVEEVYDPELEKDIPEPFRKKAPEKQNTLPSAAQAPTTDIEQVKALESSLTGMPVPVAENVDVDQMLKEMGF